MKLFVLEGPDNTGKSYFADALKTYLESNGYNKVLYIHFDAPKGDNKYECAKLEHEFSLKIAKEISCAARHNTYDAIILDRSWYSEYVYGFMYRGRTKDEILRNIRPVEDIVINSIDDTDTYYISFKASSEFLKNHEDGKSLSNADIDHLEHEIALFKEIEKYVMLHHIIKLKVNTSDNKYCAITKLLNQVTEYIN